MRILLLSSLLLLLTASAHAASITESWESTYGPLAVVGSGDPAILAEPRAGGAVMPMHELQYLELINNSLTPAPAAYVAWIKNLSPGDVVDVTVHWQDLVPGNFVLDAQWNMDPDDIYAVSESAGAVTDPDSGAGWDEVSGSWEVPQLPYSYFGLVISIPLQVANGDTVFIDGMEVTAPDGATIVTVPEAQEEVPAVWPMLLALVLVMSCGLLLWRHRTTASV